MDKEKLKPYFVIMDKNQQNIIIYNTADGKASVSLFAKDWGVWMNQSQLAELFDTSVPNISMHISNLLKEGELEGNSVIKDYLTTAADGLAVMKIKSPSSPKIPSPTTLTRKPQLPAEYSRQLCRKPRNSSPSKTKTFPITL